MTTFYDPATIRRLAAHDPFYRGAAWILDQQAAQAEAEMEARAAGWERLRAHLGDMARAEGWDPDKIPADRSVARVENWDDPWSPAPAV